MYIAQRIFIDYYVGTRINGLTEVSIGKGLEGEYEPERKNINYQENLITVKVPKMCNENILILTDTKMKLRYSTMQKVYRYRVAVTLKPE